MRKAPRSPKTRSPSPVTPKRSTPQPAKKRTNDDLKKDLKAFLARNKPSKRTRSEEEDGGEPDAKKSRNRAINAAKPPLTPRSKQLASAAAVLSPVADRLDKLGTNVYFVQEDDSLPDDAYKVGKNLVCRPPRKQVAEDKVLVHDVSKGTMEAAPEKVPENYQAWKEKKDEKVNRNQKEFEEYFLKRNAKEADIRAKMKDKRTNAPRKTAEEGAERRKEASRLSRSPALKTSSKARISPVRAPEKGDHAYSATGRKGRKAKPNVMMTGIVPRQTARKTVRAQKVGDVDLTVFREGPIERGGPLDPNLPENISIYAPAKAAEAELVIPAGGTKELDAMQGEPIEGGRGASEGPDESG